MFLFIGSQEFLVHRSIGPLVHLTISPYVQWTSDPLDHWSIGPLDHLSIGPLVHWSIGPLDHDPLVHLSIGPLVCWSIGPLDYRSIGPLVECQISNVNEVKLLSERTSGVPPIIFFIAGTSSTKEVLSFPHSSFWRVFYLYFFHIKNISIRSWLEMQNPLNALNEQQGL